MLPTIVSALTIVVALAIVLMNRRSRQAAVASHVHTIELIDQRSRIIRQLEDHMARRAVLMESALASSHPDEPSNSTESRPSTPARPTSESIDFSDYSEADRLWLAAAVRRLAPDDAWKSLLMARWFGIEQDAAWPVTEVIRSRKTVSVPRLDTPSLRNVSLVEKFGGVSFRTRYQHTSGVAGFVGGAGWFDELRATDSVGHRLADLLQAQRRHDAR